MKEELSKENKIKIAKRIKKVREEMGMSKADFAKFIGVSNQYYSTLEKGENCLSVGKIINFCNVTGLSADYILLGKVNSIDDETLKFLSNYKQKDVESIFSIIKIVMKMLHDKNT